MIWMCWLLLLPIFFLFLLIFISFILSLLHQIWLIFKKIYLTNNYNARNGKNFFWIAHATFSKCIVTTDRKNWWIKNSRLLLAFVHVFLIFSNKCPCAHFIARTITSLQYLPWIAFTCGILLLILLLLLYSSKGEKEELERERKIKRKRKNNRHLLM